MEPSIQWDQDPQVSLSQIRNGQHQPLGRMLQQCRNYLLLVANQELESQLRPKVAASDLVQETLLRAHIRFDQFRGETESELLGWLRRILLNQLADARKLYHRQRREIDQEVRIGNSASGASGVPDIAAQSATPSARAILSEQSSALIFALQSLPEKQRRIIVLRNFDRATFGEIAGQFSCSEDAARKLWSRAVVKLRDALDDPHGFV